MKRSREPEDDLGLSAEEQDVGAISVSKIVNIDTANSKATDKIAISCSLPGHAPGMGFTTYAEHEKHYNSDHTNRCLECWKNFPSAHLMNLHISEFHDALTQIRRETGEQTLACFVETCGEKFGSLQRRKQHLVKTHLYPQNYFFAVTKFGIDRRQSMLVNHAEMGRKQDRETHPKSPSSHGKWAEATSLADNLPVKDVTMSDSASPGIDNHSAIFRPRLALLKPKVVGNDEPMEDKASSQDAIICGETSSIRETGDSIAAKKEVVSPDPVMDDLAGAMSSLKFVPRTVRLGAKKKSGTPPTPR